MGVRTRFVVGVVVASSLACAGSGPAPDSPSPSPSPSPAEVPAPSAPASAWIAPLAPPAVKTPAPPAPAPVPSPTPARSAGPPTPFAKTCDWDVLLPIARDGAGFEVPPDATVSFPRCLGDWATVVFTAKGLDPRTPTVVSYTMVILWRDDGAWTAFYALPKGADQDAFCEDHAAYLTPSECSTLLNRE